MVLFGDGDISHRGLSNGTDLAYRHEDSEPIKEPVFKMNRLSPIILMLKPDYLK